jgi:hypothetical protein
MWRSRNNRDGTTVVCIACGTSIPRSEAREYDKRGNRWERHGKTFEHLCKECYRDLCHQPREGLESLLVDVEQGTAGTDFDGEATEADSEDGPPATPDDELAEDADMDRSRAAFLARYFSAVEERYGPAEEPGRES